MYYVQLIFGKNENINDYNPTYVNLFIFTSHNLYHSSDMKHIIKKWDYIRSISPIIRSLENILEFKYYLNIDVVITNTSKII